MGLPLSLSLYRTATGLAEPVVLPAILKSRLKAGKEDPARIGERQGFDDSPSPAGPVVWLHGASVGETVSLLPLVERLRERRPDILPLVTSHTVTSAELMSKRLPPGAIHRYVPADAPAAVGRFLDRWKPGLGIFVESEFWPNLLFGAKDRGAKLALVSARMTQKSADGWAKRPAAARAILGAFDLILPQDIATEIRLEKLGARIDGRANLKVFGAPLAHDPAELGRLWTAIGEREIVVAASTHAHEEALIASAVEVTRGEPLLILVPRHPARGPEVAELLRGWGRNVAVRSAGEPVTSDTDVYLADTLGELGLFLRLADVVVMGGSFMGGVGGHNPLEPARLGKPVIHGHDIGNWIDVHQALAGAVFRADTEAELIHELARLLDHPEDRDQAGKIAEMTAERLDAGFDDLWTRLEPLLP